jgi:hypothetical protein
MLTSSEQAIHTLEITKDEQIAATIDIVFETLLEQIGPNNETPERVPMPFKLEAWPGGRWYRDLGNNAGHFWGHVQAIKPPTLLEIHGPLFMSFPAVSNLQYRLTAEGDITRIKLVHRAMGQIPPEYRDGVNVSKGWSHMLTRVREIAESRKSTLRKSR